MVRLTAIYPNKPSGTFNFDYYASVHMPMVRKRLAAFGLREIGINKGVSTLDGKPPPYICIGTADFGSAEDLKRGMATHADEILADIPKYTDIEPEIQISEILMSG